MDNVKLSDEPILSQIGYVIDHSAILKQAKIRNEILNFPEEIRRIIRNRRRWVVILTALGFCCSLDTKMDAVYNDRINGIAPEQTAKRLYISQGVYYSTLRRIQLLGACFAVEADLIKPSKIYGVNLRGQKQPKP